MESLLAVYTIIDVFRRYEIVRVDILTSVGPASMATWQMVYGQMKNCTKKAYKYEVFPAHIFVGGANHTRSLG